MPELPEVETIRLQLEKFLVGRKITQINVLKAKSFPDDPKLVLGAKVVSLRRFGKVAVIDLNNGYSLLIHLKLTGQLLVNGKVGPHTRVVISFDKERLIFNDLRIFGWIRIEKSGEIEKEKFIKQLGPEPFRDLTLAKFKEILAKSGRPVKLVLMDQAKISGVGNIYANDALWLAKIDPRRSAKELNPGEVRLLYQAVLKVLREGIKYGGASDQHYLKPDGTRGEYQNHFLVYARKGEPCPRPACWRAGATIQKIFLGGRGTYFCANCQK